MNASSFVRRTLTVIGLYKSPTGKSSQVHPFFMDINPLWGNGRPTDAVPTPKLIGR